MVLQDRVCFIYKKRDCSQRSNPAFYGVPHVDGHTGIHGSDYVVLFPKRMTAGLTVTIIYPGFGISPFYFSEIFF